MFNFIKKKKKVIKLIDFSFQQVSTGQVQGMLNYLTEHNNNGFKYVETEFKRNKNGNLRCYLTIDYNNSTVIQWFADRTPGQVEDFAKRFVLEKDRFMLKDN